MRPVPERARLITLEKAVELTYPYECIIAHNITDLLDLKPLTGPRLMVVHETLDGRIGQHGLNMTPDQLRLLMQHYLEMVGGHAVAISPLKARSWKFIDDVVQNCVDVGEYHPWSGEVTAGLRVSNEIGKRKDILLWEFHEAAFKGIPVRIVGFNPDLPGVNPSKDWDDLKSILSSHRFFIHTAHLELEDGYNLALLEAMATGLPVLGNKNPTSPVEHGISGFLSDDPEELRQFAVLLLQNKDLAGKMGESARRTVAERFSVGKFVTGFNRSIETAQKKWEGRRLSDAYFFVDTSESREQVDLLVRSGYFLRLSDRLQDHVRTMDIEQAIGVLDEMMKDLGMPRDRCISSFDDLIKVILEVSDALRGWGENRAAESILKTALMLAAAERQKE